jgi:gamma-glutamyltranspeptidase/glutathione hydrolase
MPLGAPVAIVPAAPDAWITALARFGTWSFADVAEAAIEIAAEGVVLDYRTATALRILGQGFMQWESTRSIYWPQGREPSVGDRLRQPQLARLLQAMADAESGSNRAEALESVRRSFYEGDVARHIVTFIQANGGWLTLEDLATFRCEVALAPARSYHGYTVHVTDTWSQGPALLQALAILEGINLQDLGHNSAAYIHYVAEAIKLAFSDRERYYGDPCFVDVNLEWLLSDVHASELRAHIAAHAALPNLPTIPGRVRRHADTTSLCVLDAKGNAFSATPSDTLDGGPIVPDLGIIISPRGVQNRLDSAHPSVLAPGKRPRVSCPGGDVIVQAMLQVFLNRVHFAMAPQQAVEAPRIASFSFPDSFFLHTEVHDRLSVEGRIDEAVRADLADRGHHVWVWPDYEFDAGGVTLALDLEPPSQQGRSLAAAADPRRICYALGR